jgi:predicted phage terminase large subunit-like protein
MEPLTPLEIAALSPEQFAQLWEELNNENETAAEDFLWLRCATDLQLFSLCFFAHYCTYAFNDFHHQTFDETKWMERAVRRARAAPRGYAKSTLKALVKPIHDVCYGLEDYVLFVSNTQDQANGKLRDIRTEVLTNVALVEFYGLRFTKRTPGETAYEIVCAGHHAKFEAYGAGVEIRGIRFGAKRPTKIVVDDSEHSEEVMNEDLRAKFLSWYMQVISQIGNEFTNIEFIGTMLHRESLLAHLLKNPAYDGKLYKAVISWADREDLWDKWRLLYTTLDNDTRLTDADAFYAANEVEMLKGTQVLWPEKESYHWLMKEMVEKGKINFFKEKQNEPSTGNQSIFDVIHWYREVEEGLIIESSGKLIPWEQLKEHAYGVLDPATGQTKAKKGKLGDYACQLSGFHDVMKGRLFVHHDITKRLGPTKQISNIFDTHNQFNYQKFGVETNLYRNLLMPNILAERKRRQEEAKRLKLPGQLIQIAWYDIDQTENKEKRIYSLEPKVHHSYILFNRALSQEFIGQLEVFPTPGAHDDGPDALEMLWSLVNNRYKMAALDMDPMGGR